MATSVLDHAARARGAPEKTGLWSWITTVDHKRIGILYGAHGVPLLPARRARGAAHPARSWCSRTTRFVSPETYNQLFTMHGTTMIFLAVMPLVGDVLQLHDPAADRRARRGLPAAQRLQLLGVPARRAVPQRRASCSAPRPNGGWFGYANLTSRQFSPGPQRRLLGDRSADPRHRLAGGGGQLLRRPSSTCARPGMTLMRMPMFVWMSFITQILLLLAFPVITVALILLMFDRHLRHQLLRARPAAATRCSGSTCSGSSGTPRSTS